MNHISFAFISLFATACATEPTPIRSLADRAAIPGGDVRPRNLSRVEAGPGCLPEGTTIAQYGTPRHDGFRDVAITAGGEVLVAGHHDGLDGVDGEVVASGAIVLGYAGGFTPRASIDTSGTDAVEALAVSPDSGRVWLAVRTDGALPDLTSHGGFDVALASLDRTGARLLERGFGSTPEYPRQLAAGGGVIAIAGHDQRLGLDGSPRLNPFLAVYDAGGDRPTPRWFVSRHTQLTETYTAVDTSADLVATAGAIATGADQGTYIAARDHDATLRWQQGLSTTGGDRVASIRIVPGGDIVWAGTSAGDLVVGRLDGTTGAPRWSVRHGDDHDERVADLAVDDDGRIFLAGDLAATDRDQRDAFLMMLDADGRPLTHEVWSSDGDDVPSAIAIDACGTAVIVGHTTGDLGSTSNGGADGFLIATSAGRSFAAALDGDYLRVSHGDEVIDRSKDGGAAWAFHRAFAVHGTRPGDDAGSRPRPPRSSAAR